MPYRSESNTKKISPFQTAQNLTGNIKKVCRNCEVCIKNKSRGGDKIGLLSHLGPAEKPFEIVSIDTEDPEVHDLLKSICLFLWITLPDIHIHLLRRHRMHKIS